MFFDDDGNFTTAERLTRSVIKKVRDELFKQEESKKLQNKINLKQWQLPAGDLSDSSDSETSSSDSELSDAYYFSRIDKYKRHYRQIDRMHPIQRVSMFYKKKPCTKQSEKLKLHQEMNKRN